MTKINNKNETKTIASTITINKTTAVRKTMAVTTAVTQKTQE